MSEKKIALIIGAGPAGLTTAYELLTRTDYKPIVIEQSEYMGGLSRTINYKGNRIDIGGHRFFSKSDRVMDWWLEILPMQEISGVKTQITYQNKSRHLDTANATLDPNKTDKVMLLRARKSRIYFMRQFFDYPISLSLDTLSKLGPIKTVKIGISYVYQTLFPIKPENNLEEFFTNRFGSELYNTFFKSYTQKVWGLPCNKISAAWGAQRVKGLSIMKAITHAVKKIFTQTTNFKQKEIETSLIEQFLYPKHGPGQMWEEVAKLVKEKGGEIITNHKVDKLVVTNNRITKVEASDITTKEKINFESDIVVSSMPIKNLVNILDCKVPDRAKQISDGLIYRDFITVGLLVKELKIKENNTSSELDKLITDNWIYIQEADVNIGRLQIFNNWSPYMVADRNNVWLGLEYFCNKGDNIWNLNDSEMVALAKSELAKIGIIEEDKVLDATVIRVPKTYPAYFGSYDNFDELRQYLDSFENLFLVGRNGMHKYNNQDHSMLTSMVVVDNLVNGIKSKDNIWDVNTEMEYHEEKK